MNDKSAFDSLTFATKYLINGALSRLNDSKRGVETLSNNLEQIASTLSWNVEDWMTASFELQYGNWAAKALELALLETMEANGPGPQSDFDAALDRRAATIVNSIAQECLSVIYRGTDRSSNPMTILESVAKVTAARKVMEALCNLSSYLFSSGDVIADIIAGKERRAEERRAIELAKVAKIRYMKEDGEYVAVALNREGTPLEERPLEVTRKGDALTKVAAWVKTLQQQQGSSHIAVEAA